LKQDKKGNTMALIPLNTFKTKTAVVGSDSTASVYTAPIGVTSIILMTQVTNLTTGTQYVNFGHFRRFRVLPDAQGFGEQAGNTFTPLVQGFGVPKNNAASLVKGKMIIESLDKVYAFAGAENSMQLVLSILETANT